MRPYIYIHKHKHHIDTPSLLSAGFCALLGPRAPGPGHLWLPSSPVVGAEGVRDQDLGVHRT